MGLVQKFLNDSLGTTWGPITYLGLLVVIALTVLMTLPMIVDEMTPALTNMNTWLLGFSIGGILWFLTGMD